MAAVKISDLPAAAVLGGTEILPLVQSGTTVKGLISAIGTYVRGLFTTTPATLAEGGTGAATAVAAMAVLGDTRSSVAMHATNMDIWGPYNSYDGSGGPVAVTALAAAPYNGMRRTLYPYAGSTLSGTNFYIDGGAALTAAAGDAWIFESYTSTTFRVHVTKYDGRSVALPATMTATVGGLVPTPPNNTTTFLRGDGTFAAPVSGLTLKTPVASTSGSAIGFTSIPTGTKRITVNFKSVSTNGTAVLQIQIGDSGGYENSGYTGGVGDRGGEVAISTGFTIIRSVSAGGLYSGSVILSLEDSSDFTWSALGILSLESIGQINFSSGVKSLSAELDRIQVITTDTFIAGEINISYE